MHVSPRRIFTTAAILAIALRSGGCSTRRIPESGSDGGSDAGADAGTDAGTDGGSDAGASFDGGSPIGGDSVLMHHKNPNRDGVYIESALTVSAISTLHRDTSFVTSGIVGNVYAQPLFVDNDAGPDLVIVATEADQIYALNAATGAAVWTVDAGTPVPLATLATCGNIDPVGVTGTPVIDPITRTLFFDAELIPASGVPTHRVFALSVDDGSSRPGWPVDIPSNVHSGSIDFISNVQGQRGALAVVGGRVYIPYGGRFGDCGDYHGWVVGISIYNPSDIQVWLTPTHGGGAWMPGGIATDGTDLFIATGNTFGASATWGGGDAMIRLSPESGLSMSGYFAPANWKTLDNEDLDMGTAPVLFDLPGSTPSALAILFGKDTNAYLLDRNSLPGTGAALGGNVSLCTPTSSGACATRASVATAEIISAAALYTTATATYVAVKAPGASCTGGLTSSDLLTLRIVPGSPPTLAPSWCGRGGLGSPMVTTSDGHADAIVWTLGAQSDSRLHGFLGDTGAPVAFTASTTAYPGMRAYNTPIAAKGRIFVPVDGPTGVIAFSP